MRYAAIGLAALLMAGCGGGDASAPRAPQGPDPTDFVLEIEGRVWANGVGASIAGARVVIRTPNRRNLSTVTDVDGNYAVRARLPESACESDFGAGKWLFVPCTVEVAAGGYRPKSIQHDFDCHSGVNSGDTWVPEPQRLDIALEAV